MVNSQADSPLLVVPIRSAPVSTGKVPDAVLVGKLSQLWPILIGVPNQHIHSYRLQALYEFFIADARLLEVPMLSPAKTNFFMSAKNREAFIGCCKVATQKGEEKNFYPDRYGKG